jgi:hypothetical protein
MSPRLDDYINHEMLQYIGDDTQDETLTTTLQYHINSTNSASYCMNSTLPPSYLWGGPNIHIRYSRADPHMRLTTAMHQ